MMDVPLRAQLLALLPTLLGVVACYLASPHQHLWPARPGAAGVWQLAGGLLLLIGAWRWISAMGGAGPGIAAWLVAAMITAVLLRYAATWLRTGT